MVAKLDKFSTGKELYQGGEKMQKRSEEVNNVDARTMENGMSRFIFPADHMVYRSSVSQKRFDAQTSEQFLEQLSRRTRTTYSSQVSQPKNSRRHCTEKWGL